MNREQAALQKLKGSGLFLAVVESCTGGLISQRLTDVAGASDSFWGGMVTYDNSAKISLVGVPSGLITQYGAVSREVAQAMAQGGLARMTEAMKQNTFRPGIRGYICVSTTGVAGPSGGSVQKPVGLCYVGIAVATTSNAPPASVIEVRAPEGLTRDEYRTAFSNAAFDLLIQTLAK